MGGVAHGSGPEAGSCSSCIGRIRPDSITEGEGEGGREERWAGRARRAAWMDRKGKTLSLRGVSVVAL